MQLLVGEAPINATSMPGGEGNNQCYLSSDGHYAAILVSLLSSEGNHMVKELAKWPKQQST
jgi:hypothetical protein